MDECKTKLIYHMREMIDAKKLTRNRAQEMIQVLFSVPNEGWKFLDAEVNLALPPGWISPQANKKRKESVDLSNLEDSDEEEDSDVEVKPSTKRPEGDPIFHTPAKIISYKRTEKQARSDIMKSSDSFVELQSHVRHHLKGSRAQFISLHNDTGEDPRSSPQRALQYALWLLDAHESTIARIHKWPIPYVHDHVRIDNAKPAPQLIPDICIPEGYHLTELTKWPIAACINPNTERHKLYHGTKVNNIAAASFPLLIEFAHPTGRNGNGRTLTTYTVIHPGARIMMPFDNRDIKSVTSDNEAASEPNKPHYWYGLGKQILQQARDGDPDKLLGDDVFMSKKIGCKIFPVKNANSPTSCEARKQLYIQVMYALAPDIRKQPPPN